jgi:N utilization substance protein A
MAVFSNNPDIDAIGSSIGPKGARVNKIVEELGGEKIDIIEYSDDPVKYISAALSPANVIKVEIIDETTKSCRATVPDGQLSLAIGNKGQNARLAARLTGWKIDIRPESGFYGEDDDDEIIAEENTDEKIITEESPAENTAIEETAEEKIADEKTADSIVMENTDEDFSEDEIVSDDTAEEEILAE